MYIQEGGCESHHLSLLHMSYACTRKTANQDSQTVKTKQKIPSDFFGVLCTRIGIKVTFSFCGSPQCVVCLKLNSKHTVLP